MSKQPAKNRPSIDPAYRAIAAHRLAMARYESALDVLGVYEAERRKDTDPSFRKAERAAGRCGVAETSAADRLTLTVPTTTAGLLAVLKHVDVQISAGNRMLDENGAFELISTAVKSLKSLEAQS